MKAAIRKWSSPNESGERLFLWCPACDDVHQIEVDKSRPTSWEWDGNLDAPTISPSILVNGTQLEDGATFHRKNHRVAAGERTVCHSFVRSGRWEFLGDCTHTFAGQTVEMVDLPEWVAPTHEGESE